jgi:hypothetical protein
MSAFGIDNLEVVEFEVESEKEEEEEDAVVVVDEDEVLLSEDSSMRKLTHSSARLSPSTSGGGLGAPTRFVKKEFNKDVVDGIKPTTSF